MQGDSIVIEAHHRKAAAGCVPLLLPLLEASSERYTVSIAGESGSGKSETAVALSEALAEHDITSAILQQVFELFGNALYSTHGGRYPF